MSTKNGFSDPETFASCMGQAVWLMTVSKEHRGLPISEIELRVSPAILLQQFRIFLKGKRPIAFLSWAAVSEEVKARFESGNKDLEVNDWRSGKNILIVDCISPFADRRKIEEQFLETLKMSDSGLALN